jgi:high affinity Mn2+ porin
MASLDRFSRKRFAGTLIAGCLILCAPATAMTQSASDRERDPAAPIQPTDSQRPRLLFANSKADAASSGLAESGFAAAIFRAAAPAPASQIAPPQWLDPTKASATTTDQPEPADTEEGKKAVDENTGTNPAKEKPEALPPWLSVHEQGTVVIQRNPSFRSPYQGPNSLLPFAPGATTETGTLYLDARLWRGADFVFNPEIAGGRGLSHTLGIAGFPNGEATRVGNPDPTPYFARIFFRQTWGLGGEWERVEDGANQLAGPRDINRITFTIGKMSAADQFDTNAYSHDPRTQFMNWSLMYDGAWDYPANTRGYTYGATIEINTVWWAARYGIFTEPTFANGPQFDHLDRANGEIWEIEQHWGMDSHPGKLHEFFFLNLAQMGNYDLAVATNPASPNVDATRGSRMKYGFGSTLEQELTTNLGFFMMAGWNDGHTEDWAFTEIDRSVSGGFLLKGTQWRRPNDTVGLAGVINGLSGPHRSYLEHGGIGFIIGDGKLNYYPEQIVEAFYNLQLAKGVNITADVQGINNPGYNADRGPVAVFGVRIHVEH